MSHTWLDVSHILAWNEITRVRSWELFLLVMSRFSEPRSQKKSFRNTPSKTALLCSNVISINRSNKTIYKHPITPLDIDHRYLSWKVDNVEEKAETVHRTMDSIMNHNMKALPVVRVHDAGYTTGPCRDVNFEPSLLCQRKCLKYMTLIPHTRSWISDMDIIQLQNS